MNILLDLAAGAASAANTALTVTIFSVIGLGVLMALTEIGAIEYITKGKALPHKGHNKWT